MSATEKAGASLDKVRQFYTKTVERLLEGIGGKMTGGSLESEIETATANRWHKSTKFFVSGISGSGKSTITETLKHAGYEKLRNITTRAPRPGETEDDYIFIDPETFKQWQAKDLIFHPHITNKVYHGIRNEDLEKFTGSGKLYTDKSVGSILSMTKEIPSLLTDAVFIYLLPPSFDELARRIIHREQHYEHGMSLAEIAERFEEEIEDLARTIDLPYVYIVNDDRERVQKLLETRI